MDGQRSSSTGLAGKVALITGGANGIGRAIAIALAEAGADIYITSRADREALDGTCRELSRLGGRVGGSLLECYDDSSVGVLFDRATCEIGRPNVLVNNAAVGGRSTFLEMSESSFDTTLGVNLRFPFFALQRFARDLIDAGEGGSAINVSSISSFKAISKMSAYQCSKAGLSMLTKGAAYELAPFGIRVNTLSPGLTATKANRDQWRDHPEVWAERGKELPLGRAGTPEDFASAAVFLASAASSWMTGADLVIDGGDSVI